MGGKDRIKYNNLADVRAMLDLDTELHRLIAFSRLSIEVRFS
jgi:hypothetical protein